LEKDKRKKKKLEVAVNKMIVKRQKNKKRSKRRAIQDKVEIEEIERMEALVENEVK